MEDNNPTHVIEEKVEKEDDLNDFEKIPEEFKELNNKLNEPLNHDIIYHDKEKLKRKYQGEIKDGKYDGRGILYAFSGKVEYDGYFKNGEYDGFGREFNFYDNKLKYEGFFSNYKYNGKGILYYKNGKIFFIGIFKENEYVNGILYDPEGNIIYKGEIINKNPKEGKNIKLYEINGDLIYHGDFLDGKYNGKGILYEAGKYEIKGVNSEFKGIKYNGEFSNGNFEGKGKLYMDHIRGKYLYYEGKFNNGLFNDEGILYYQNGKKFYEGNFKNGEIFGKGTKFYKNGAQKLEGNFENLNSFEGKYYDPENKELYNGKILNKIPVENKKIILYDDNTNKIYEGDIKDGTYEGEGVEYFPLIKNMILYKGNFAKNYYIDQKEVDEKEVKPLTIGIFYKFNETDAKNLINRFLGKEINTGLEEKKDLYTFKYEYNKVNYVINFLEPFGKIKNSRVAECDIILYLFDLNSDHQIKETDFDEIERLNKKNPLIYLIGNNLNYLEKIDMTYECLEEYREEAIKLISGKKANKYFEISIETGEKIDNLKKNIEIDSSLYFNNNQEENKEEKKSYFCSIF